MTLRRKKRLFSQKRSGGRWIIIFVVATLVFGIAVLLRYPDLALI